MVYWLIKGILVTIDDCWVELADTTNGWPEDPGSARNNQNKETKKERKKRGKKGRKNKAEQSGPGRSWIFMFCVSVMTTRKSNAAPIGQQVQILRKLLCASCSARPSLNYFKQNSKGLKKNPWPSCLKPTLLPFPRLPIYTHSMP